MLKKVWQLAGGICAFLLFSLILMPGAEAKTFTAKNSLGNYEVTINIVFDFSSVSVSRADSLLVKWQNGIASIWDNKIIDNEQEIKFVFDLRKMAAGKTCSDYPDYHCLKVIDDFKNSRGSISDISFNKPNSNKNAIGEWTVYTSGLDAAHEAGHLMGLPDRYHFEIKNNKRILVNDSYRTAGFTSIMSRTWGKVAAYGEDIRQIVDYADKKEANSYSMAVKQ